MKHSCFAVFCLVVTTLTSYGNDSIPAISLAAATIEVSEGGLGSRYQLDSLIAVAMPFSSIGDQLQYGSVVNLRLYGAPGSLVSGLGGGLSPDHLLVLWEGIPINSPSLGMTDLSSLPASFFSSVSYNDGTSKSAHQGGASGILSLRNTRSDHAEVQGGMSWSSLKNFQMGGGFNIPIGGFTFNGSIQNEQLENEFSYVDPFKKKGPEEMQIHNDFSRKALRLGIYSPENKKITAAVHAWIQQSAFEIPSELGSYGSSLATQRDSSIRLVGQLSTRFKNGDLSVKAAYFIENQHYIDRESLELEPFINSQITTYRKYSSADYRLFGERWALLASFSFNHETANYSTRVASRLLAGPKAHVIWHMNKWELNVGGRYDMGPGAQVFVPDFSTTYYGQSFEAGMGGGRIFRYPDLNELYWQPGGNVHLQPELGATVHAFLLKKFNSNNSSLRISPFFKQMSSMVVWEPLHGHYSAHNANQVDVKGMVMTMSHLHRMDVVVLHEEIDVNTQSISGLSYVISTLYPVLNGRGKVGVGYKNWSLAAIARYSSLNYMPEHLNAERGQQDALLMFDVVFTGQLRIKNNSVQYTAGIWNLGDIMDYRMSSVASPGRTINFSIQWKWKAEK